MSNIDRMKELFARYQFSRPHSSTRGRWCSTLSLDELGERIMPATRIWSGLGSNDKWTTPTNWQGGVAPIPGEDDLRFPAGASRLATNENDFPDGTEFLAIRVETTATLNGNALKLTNTGGAFVADINAGTVTVNLANVIFTNDDAKIQTVKPGTNIVFNAGSKITIDSNNLIFNSESTGANKIQVSAPIVGTGGVTIDGPGIVIFSPQSANPNNYNGDTKINQGLLRLQSNLSNVKVIPGDITVGDGNVLNGSAKLEQTLSELIDDSANLQVLADGVYNLGTTIERVAIVDIGSAEGGGQILGTGTGKLILGGDLTVTNKNPTTGSKITAQIELINPTTTFNVPLSSDNNAGPDLLLTGAITGAANLDLVIDGGGRVEMQAVNTGGYTTNVYDGTLILNKNAGTGGGGSVPGKLIIGNGLPGSAEVRIAQSNSIADATVVTIEKDGQLTTSIFSGTDKIAGLVATEPNAQVNLGVFTLQIAPPTDFVYDGQVSGDGRIQIVAPTGFALPGRQTFAGPVNLTGIGFGPYSLTVDGGQILEVLQPVTGGGGGISSAVSTSSEKIYFNSISQNLQTFPNDKFYPGSLTLPGLASTVDVDFKGLFVSRINSPAVFGALQIFGQVNQLSDLRVELPTIYKPSVGEAFKILDIIDPSVRLAINGITFKGLPEGARFFDSTGTVEFQITYAGGDGNDVLIINTGSPLVTVKRDIGQPMVTNLDTASFLAEFSGPVQPIVPPAVSVATIGTANYESIQILQITESKFLITLQGLSGNGSVAVSLKQGAAFSLAGTPSQPSFSIADENVVIVNTGGGGSGGGGPAPIIPPSGITGGFFSSTPGPRTLVGAGVGGGGQVNVYQVRTQPAGQFRMLDSAFTNGVRVATADFNRDGVQDYVVGSGPGGVTNVQVLDGKTGTVLFSVQPFESSFTGGVYVAAGDLNGDAIPDLVISPDEGGGPRVQIYSGSNFVKIADFFGINDPDFRGGARIAVGDLDGDGFGDLVVAAGFGGGPRIATYNGKFLAAGQIVNLTSDFFAFEPGLRNGTFVAVADINGDGFGDLVTGAGPGGAPRVTVFDGLLLASGGSVPNLLPISNFFAGPETNRGGVPLGITDFNGDGIADLVTGTGVGEGSRVRVYPVNGLSAANPPLIADFDAFPGFTGGVFVG